MSEYTQPEEHTSVFDVTKSSRAMVTGAGLRVLISTLCAKAALLSTYTGKMIDYNCSASTTQGHDMVTGQDSETTLNPQHQYS